MCLSESENSVSKCQSSADVKIWVLIHTIYIDKLDSMELYPFFNIDTGNTPEVSIFPFQFN